MAMGVCRKGQAGFTHRTWHVSPFDLDSVGHLVFLPATRSESYTVDTMASFAHDRPRSHFGFTIYERSVTQDGSTTRLA